MKIAVFRDGRIGVNGAPSTLESLCSDLRKLAERKGSVWYYREAAGSGPPPEVKEITQAIADNHLPIRFSTLPDYSDSVGPLGNDKAALDRLFDEARKLSGLNADDSGRRRVIVVTPWGRLLAQNCPLPGSVAEEQVAKMRRVLPPEPQRTLVAIANTNVSDKRPIQSAIPFLGMLIGLAYIGHRVIVFDGELAAIESACRGADVLIVDSELAGFLTPVAYAAAIKVMQRPEIYVHDRGSFKLQKFRLAKS